MKTRATTGDCTLQIASLASSPRVARQMDPLDSKQSAEPRTAASPLESPHNPDDLAVPFPPSPIHDRRAGRIMKALGSETDPNPRRKICLLLFEGCIKKPLGRRDLFLEQFLI